MFNHISDVLFSFVFLTSLLFLMDDPFDGCHSVRTERSCIYLYLTVMENILRKMKLMMVKIIFK